MLLQLPDLLISDIQMVLFYLWCEGMDTETEECVLKERDQLTKLDQLKQLLEMTVIIYQGYKTNHSCLHVSHEILKGGKIC